MNTSFPTSEPEPIGVTQAIVPNHRRIVVASQLFGIHFPMRLEPTVFAFASRLRPDYQGGYWRFYTLSNGGFYMAPEAASGFKLQCDNGFEGALSADAFGITVCLYAYSHLSFREDDFGALCGEHYHRLRALALEHNEVTPILSAID